MNFVCRTKLPIIDGSNKLFYIFRIYLEHKDGPSSMTSSAAIERSVTNIPVLVIRDKSMLFRFHLPVTSGFYRSYKLYGRVRVQMRTQFSVRENCFSMFVCIVTYCTNNVEIARTSYKKETNLINFLKPFC